MQTPALRKSSRVANQRRRIHLHYNEKGKLFELPFGISGAGEESRTLDLNLGKVALYQLSYSRIAGETQL